MKENKILKIITLGTGHGSATATNMSSVTYLECGGKTYLVDCADGADAAMVRKNLIPSALSAVFLTHMHLDHTGGLPAIMKRNLKYEGEAMTILLPEMEAAAVMEKWLSLNGFGPKFEANPGAFTYLDPREGFDDGNIQVKAFPTKHRAAAGMSSYAYTIRGEGKKLCFTGDLLGDCSDFPFEAADHSDLVVSELTHFRMKHIRPFLEKLDIKALVFNHLGNWSQVPEEQKVIREECKKLPYPVTLAFDGMELSL